MFLQVYADGTVIDGEGVHRLGAEAIRPIVQLLQSGELARVEGHCGGPPADFIEQVYVVAYERRLGGLRAIPFSYSGNTAGCTPAVRQLHQALEALQTRLSSPPGAAGSAPLAAPTVPADAPGLAPPLATGTGSGTSLSLTPSR